MIQSSSCPQWQLDRPGPAGDHDGLAVVTPLTGTRSAQTPTQILGLFDGLAVICIPPEQLVDLAVESKGSSHKDGFARKGVT